MSKNRKNSILANFPQFALYHATAIEQQESAVDLEALAELLGFVNVNHEAEEISITAEESILFLRVDTDEEGDTVFQAGERTFMPRHETLSSYFLKPEDALAHLATILEERDENERSARKHGTRR